MIAYLPIPMVSSAVIVKDASPPIVGVQDNFSGIGDENTFQKW